MRRTRFVRGFALSGELLTAALLLFASGFAAPRVETVLLGIRTDTLVSFFLVDSAGIVLPADSSRIRPAMPVLYYDSAAVSRSSLQCVVRHLSREPSGDADYYEYGLARVGPPLESRPRTATRAATKMSSEFYRPVLEKSLAAIGESTDNLRVYRALKIDLDRNGEDELVFCAGSAAGRGPGGSIVGLRFIDGKTVRTVVVARERCGAGPDGAECCFANADIVFVDVNCDGVAEILYRFSDYRCETGLWDTYHVVQFDGKRMIDRHIDGLDIMVRMYAR